MALNERQKLFVKEYLVDQNATKAAERAGYSKKTAAKIGSENLQKPDIHDAIQVHLNKVHDKLDISIEKIQEELADMGFKEMSAITALSGFKYSDKTKALELLGKSLSMFKDVTENKLSGELNVKITVNGHAPKVKK